VVHFGRNLASERFLYTSRIVKRDVYASYQRSYSDHNYGQLKMQLEIRILQKKNFYGKWFNQNAYSMSKIIIFNWVVQIEFYILLLVNIHSTMVDGS
jgi:hypothetical protein